MNDTKKSNLSVFLSHSHKDVEKIRKIRDVLEVINCNPIMFYLKCLDDDNEVLEEFIKKEIEARNIFIYCKSKNSEESIWVKKELEYIRQLDKNRLYEIDIEEGFTHSLPNILMEISKLLRRNTIILCNFNPYEDKTIANNITQKLSEKGYRIENVSIEANYAPTIKNLPTWEFQKYKTALEVYLENNIYPIIQTATTKGIFVPIISPHLFNCDNQWASMIISKIAHFCETRNCLYVPIQIKSNISEEFLADILDKIYLKSIE